MVKMELVKILLFSESRYPVNRRKIRKAITEILDEQEIKGPVEISVAIVGDRKMRALNKKFRNIEGTTNVLSFPTMEGEPAILPPDGILHLGDIIVSFPQAVSGATKKEVMVDEEIAELVKHGLLHLLGINHE